MPIIAVICIVVFPPWAAIWTWISPLPDTVQEQVDVAIDRGLDGIIVYVDEAGKDPAYYSAGWKDRDENVPLDPQALFKIASISKLYIAAAATKMVADEQLSLDDRLTDHLPQLADRIENADQITLRMMLKHRSGIPNFTDDPAFPWSAPPSDLADYLKLGLDKPAEFDPDQRYKYSNTNYLLIGNILDKVLGYSHHRYINEEILIPLELSHTYSLLSEVALADVVSGYYVEHDGDQKELDYISPGGSMVATAQEVGVFLRAMIDGTLFTAEEQAIYTSVYDYEHTGLLPGYQSIARYHEDIDAVVIQFVNTTGGNTWSVAISIYNRIVKILRKH